jgi:hypothetical protein
MVLQESMGRMGEEGGEGEERRGRRCEWTDQTQQQDEEAKQHAEGTTGSPKHRHKAQRQAASMDKKVVIGVGVGACVTALTMAYYYFSSQSGSNKSALSSTGRPHSFRFPSPLNSATEGDFFELFGICLRGKKAVVAEQVSSKCLLHVKAEIAPVPESQPCRVVCNLCSCCL